MPSLTNQSKVTSNLPEDLTLVSLRYCLFCIKFLIFKIHALLSKYCYTEKMKFTGCSFTGSYVSLGLGLGPAKVIVLHSWVALDHTGCTLQHSKIELLNSTVARPLGKYCNSHNVLAWGNHLLVLANGAVGAG